MSSKVLNYIRKSVILSIQTYLSNHLFIIIKIILYWISQVFALTFFFAILLTFSFYKIFFINIFSIFPNLAYVVSVNNDFISRYFVDQWILQHKSIRKTSSPAWKRRFERRSHANLWIFSSFILFTIIIYQYMVSFFKILGWNRKNNLGILFLK